MVKVNLSKGVPEEYKGILKEEMTMKEIQDFGSIVMKQKITAWKNKWHAFWHRSK